MKKIYTLIALFTGLIAFSSCDEWDPVFTGKYKDVEVSKPVKMEANTSIAELKALYTKGKPVLISKNIVIAGQVTTEDKSGNLFKSLYIQDATGAIEIKVGRNGLYNDYKLGQWLYINCSGLSIGEYEGMLQLGFADPSGKYETSYLESPYLIDTHIFKGEVEKPIEPLVITEKNISDPANLGKFVTIPNVKYGSSDSKKEIFCLVYLDPKGDTKSQSNRFFISGKTYGVDTWAMSKDGFLKYLENGNFDSVPLASGGSTIEDHKETLKKNAQANAVSQYFHLGGIQIQVRSSGYARFADQKIDKAILDGATISLTGILTKYRDSYQFTLIDVDGAKIQE